MLNSAFKDKVDPFKEAEMLNSNLNNQQDNDKLSEDSSGASLISRLSTVKNKAINVGSKAFSMVSEVANKSFDIKNEKFKEDAKSDLGDPNKENSSERIEPSFLNNTKESSFNNSNYDDTFERGLSKEDDSMNIPSFWRRNRLNICICIKTLLALTVNYYSMVVVNSYKILQRTISEKISFSGIDWFWKNM